MQMDFYDEFLISTNKYTNLHRYNVAGQLLDGLTSLIQAVFIKAVQAIWSSANHLERQEWNS